MSEKLTMDRLEALLEDMEPAEIRATYAEELRADPRFESFLQAFDTLDDQLGALKAAETPPRFSIDLAPPRVDVQRPVTPVSPRHTWMRLALPLAAVLILGFIFTTRQFIEHESATVSSDRVGGDIDFVDMATPAEDMLQEKVQYPPKSPPLAESAPDQSAGEALENRVLLRKKEQLIVKPQPQLQMEQEARPDSGQKAIAPPLAIKQEAAQPKRKARKKSNPDEQRQNELQSSLREKKMTEAREGAIKERKQVQADEPTRIAKDESAPEKNVFSRESMPATLEEQRQIPEHEDQVSELVVKRDGREPRNVAADELANMQAFDAGSYATEEADADAGGFDRPVNRWIDAFSAGWQSNTFPRDLFHEEVQVRWPLFGSDPLTRRSEFESAWRKVVKTRQFRLELLDGYRNRIGWNLKQRRGVIELRFDSNGRCISIRAR